MSSKKVSSEDIEKKRSERYSTMTSQTEKATNFVRQMMVAGIAIVWMLLTKEPNGESTTPYDETYLKISLLLMCVTLFMELMHYVSSIIVYLLKSTVWLTEKDDNGKIYIQPVSWLDMLIPWILFGLKIISAIAAYVFLGIAILQLL